MEINKRKTLGWLPLNLQRSLAGSDAQLAVIEYL